MAKKPPKGQQLVSNPSDPWQVSLNMTADEDFINGQGTDFIHYKAVPSSIGMKERGDYRKIDAPDIAASNGFKYICAGEFTAVMVSNNKSKNPIDGGLFDESTARLIMPRFYNKDGTDSGGKRIHLAPGDRVYIKDADVEVPNYQKMTYNPGREDIAQFPITCVEYLEDSQGIVYTAGRHFKVNQDGNIQWIGQKNPGIDPDTGKGRVYSIRYLYSAHYYVLSIPNEVRVGRVTEGGVRSPQRMPYHCVLQREYVYHNQVNSNKPEVQEKKTKRTKEKPQETAGAYTPIQVNMNIVDSDD